MGSWWWSSSSDNKNAQQQQQEQLLDQNTITQSPPQSLSSPQEPPKPILTRDEQADAEIRDFLRSLESSSTTSSTSPALSTTSATTSTEDNTSSPSTENNPNSIAPDSLYPDTMSCRSAFDYAFFCQSFGGQWVNVYRYGELRSCNEHWENFWLCMRARSLDDNTRKEMIRNHYRKKAIKFKTGPSSEDVWEVRMEPLKGAFQGDFEAYEKEMERQEAEQQNKQGSAMEKEVVAR